MSNGLTHFSCFLSYLNFNLNFNLYFFWFFGWRWWSVAISEHYVCHRFEMYWHVCDMKISQNVKIIINSKSNIDVSNDWFLFVHINHLRSSKMPKMKRRCQTTKTSFHICFVHRECFMSKYEQQSTIHWKMVGDQKPKLFSKISLCVFLFSTCKQRFRIESLSSGKMLCL